MKCFYCEIGLETDDCYNIEVDPLEEINRLMVGHCPACKKDYQWTEKYKYTESVDLFLSDWE